MYPTVILGGVQGSLNSLMDCVKSVLVIILPDDKTFGWLVIASYACYILGMVFYSSYACQ